jgi:opacity protein-like surface antigen
LRNYGGQPFALPVPTLNGDIEDTKAWGIGLGAGYSFTDKFSLILAGGFDHLSNSGWGEAWGGEDSYTRWALWLGAPYKLTNNLTIEPEIMYFNYGDAVGLRDVDAGSEWILGASFTFLF